MSMFINLTNHPSSGWTKEQKEAARKYGEIVDISFPNIDQQTTESEIKKLADDYVATIKSRGKVQDLTVHIMGEQTFCYALISKLQKEGIRCLASCTERDTFTNEQSQKISNFHFARFREYVPPRSLRWWKILKAGVSNILHNFLNRKQSYCWTALTVILIFEALAVVYMLTHSMIINLLAIVTMALPLILLLVSRIKGFKFSIRSAIVSKLLANAIAPSALGTLYLLVFIIHIGWLGNAVLGLFTDFDHVFYSAIVCVWGIVVLVVFFPAGKEKKSDNPKKVFVSGISAINFSQHNLTPLLRILQLTNENDTCCELLILHSNYYSNQVNQVKISDNFNQYYKDELIQYETENPNYQSKTDGETIDKLKELIRIAAINKFPEKKWIAQGLEITFTDEEADYNRFESCYGILNKYIKEKDNDNNILIFNLTPGTGIVGSLMTLMAIDGDRSLYYFSQDTSLQENQRLKEVDKSQIPLKNLLSQALETLEDSK